VHGEPPEGRRVRDYTENSFYSERRSAGNRAIRRLRIKRSMRIALNIVGAVLVLFGLIWFLQGINVLPGSFMTGQIRWAVYGGIAFAAGVALLVTANRRGLTGRR
jgi:hypothetical protein